MNGWTLFFVFIGALFLSAQMFRIIDLIEQPPRHHRRRSTAR